MARASKESLARLHAGAIKMRKKPVAACLGSVHSRGVAFSLSF
jgi:hypothetical protein